MKADLIFLYRNWRGNVGVRRVTLPQEKKVIEIKTSLYHNGPQPILTAWDISKEAFREFAMNDILAFLHDAKEMPPPQDGTSCDLWIRNPRTDSYYMVYDRAYIPTIGWCERGMQVIMRKEMEILYWRKSP